MRRLVPAAICVALIAAACGSGPGDAISETAAHLGDIRSGEMQLRAVLDGAHDLGGGPAGFELSGPFELAEAGKLPVAEITYTQIAGPEEGAATLISTGDAAYVDIGDGSIYELGEDRVASLRAPEGEGTDEGPFSQLAIEEWVEDPDVAEGDSVDGEQTERVSGRLDVPTALNDLLETAARFGAEDVAGLGPLEGTDAEQIDNAVRSATIELVTGAKDRLLRELRVVIEFGVEASDEVPDDVASLLGAELTFDLALEQINEPVDVQAPDDAVPLPEG